MEKGNRANVHRFRRRTIALAALAVIIFASIEVYAHTYVQIHGLPVVTEEEVHRFSDWQYYTGTFTFSSSGCRWLVGWIVGRPAPSFCYVDMFKTEQNGSYFVLSTDFLVSGLETTSNKSTFWAHMDEINYEKNYTDVRIDYEFGEIGTYQINFALRVRVYERALFGLMSKEDVTIPINATVYYGP